MSANAVPNLRSLPKAHLHVHLEGAMRPATLGELATRDGIPVPVVQKKFGTFADFQDLYVTAVRLLGSFDDLRRLVTEVVEDAAADGAVWIEPAIHLPHHARLGSCEQVLDVLISAGLAAQEATGVGVGWLITADRTVSPELAVEQAVVASRNSDRGVVAFGLANDESAAPPELFAEAFAIARAGGLIAAPHAGEHGGADSVQQAVETLGADRIQHGVRAIEDDLLITRLVDDRICLDVCPTSNVALSVVADYSDHPLSSLLARGVACTINADDPLLFGVGLLDEYRVCRDTLELDATALAGCARTSIEHSGAPTELKTRCQRAIDRWLTEAPPATQ